MKIPFLQLWPLLLKPATKPSPRSHRERIVAAAVLKGGRIWAGRHHGKIVPDASVFFGSLVRGDEQGFLVSRGDGAYRFVGRLGAMQIARSADQIVGHPAPQTPFLTANHLGW